MIGIAIMVVLCSEELPVKRRHHFYNEMENDTKVNS